MSAEGVLAFCTGMLIFFVAAALIVLNALSQL